MDEVMIRRRIRIPDYSMNEERFNSTSHALGAVFGAVALVMMMAKAEGVQEMGCAVLYGITMILLYSVSAAYHALSPAREAKGILRIADHCMVFLLVLGTCIPVFLLGIGGPLGRGMLGGIIAFTILGIALNIWDMDRFQAISAVLHLVCGWSVMFGLRPLSQQVGITGIALFLAGGICYTLGAVLYAIGAKHKYWHGVFHVFCLFGTVLQFIPIYLYLI